MIEVVFLEAKDDRWERKGNIAYFFREKESEKKYKWSTSGNNHYGIYEGKEYWIEYKDTREIEDEAIRIKCVRIYEKLLDGEVRRITNKKGIYKEWM